MSWKTKKGVEGGEWLSRKREDVSRKTKGMEGGERLPRAEQSSRKEGGDHFQIGPNSHPYSPASFSSSLA